MAEQPKSDLTKAAFVIEFRGENLPPDLYDSLLTLLNVMYKDHNITILPVRELKKEEKPSQPKS